VTVRRLAFLDTEPEKVIYVNAVFNIFRITQKIASRVLIKMNRVTTK
jgi:hypothetical protein